MLEDLLIQVVHPLRSADPVVNSRTIQRRLKLLELPRVFGRWFELNQWAALRHKDEGHLVLELRLDFFPRDILLKMSPGVELLSESSRAKLTTLPNISAGGKGFPQSDGEMARRSQMVVGHAWVTEEPTCRRRTEGRPSGIAGLSHQRNAEHLLQRQQLVAVGVGRTADVEENRHAAALSGVYR